MRGNTRANVPRLVLRTMIFTACLAVAQGNGAARAAGGPRQDRGPRPDQPGSEIRPSGAEHGFASGREIDGLLNQIQLNLYPDTGLRELYRPFWAVQTIQGGRIAVPMLMRRFREHHGGGTFELYLLEEIGPNGAEAVPELIGLLKTAQEKRTNALGDPIVPYPGDVCDVLAAIGPKARPAALVLLDFLNDRDAHVRMAAVHALVEIGCQTPSVEAATKALLHQGRPEVREWALSKMFGPGRNTDCLAAAVRPELERMLADPSNEVRVEAAQALAHCEDSTDRVVQTLTGLLIDWDDDDTHPRAYEGLALLSRLGPRAQRAVPRIRAFLSHKRMDGLRCIALVALLAIEGPSDQIDRDIIDSIEKSPVFIVRPEIASTLLASKGPLQDAAIHAALEFLDGTNRLLEPRIMFATVDKLGEKAAPLVPGLVKILREKDPCRCQLAARALGRIGLPAPEVLDALRHAATGPDVCTRLQARGAILQLHAKMKGRP